MAGPLPAASSDGSPDVVSKAVEFTTELEILWHRALDDQTRGVGIRSCVTATTSADDKTSTEQAGKLRTILDEHFCETVQLLIAHHERAHRFLDADATSAKATSTNTAGIHANADEGDVSSTAQSVERPNTAASIESAAEDRHSTNNGMQAGLLGNGSAHDEGSHLSVLPCPPSLPEPEPPKHRRYTAGAITGAVTGAVTGALKPARTSLASSAARRNSGAKRQVAWSESVENRHRTSQTLKNDGLNTEAGIIMSAPSMLKSGTVESFALMACDMDPGSRHRPSTQSVPWLTTERTGTLDFRANIVDMVSKFKRGDTARIDNDGEAIEFGQVQTRGFMDIDIHAMKEKVRMTAARPKYNVVDLYRTSGLWAHIASSSWFENLGLTMIFSNFIWIGVELDFNNSPTLAMSDAAFQIGEHFFCTFFAFEWLTRLLAFERKCKGIRDGWFVFDTVLVLVTCIDVWVMTVVFLSMPASWQVGADSERQSASGLQMFRLVRVLRVARMAHVLRAFPEATTIMRGMTAGLRNSFVVLCMLAIVIYIFAIIFKTVLDGSEVGDVHFTSVPKAMRTLLLKCTFGEDLPDVMDAVGNHSWFAALTLLFFVFVSAVTIMNMLVGMLVEVVYAISAIEKERIAVNLVQTRIQDLVADIDRNRDGSIDRREFERLLENPRACSAFSDVGIDPIGLVDFADFIFESGTDSRDDVSHKQGGRITLAQFMDTVLQLRGTNQATVKDVVDLRKFVQLEFKRMTSVFWDTMREMLEEIETSTTDAMHEQLEKHGRSSLASVDELLPAMPTSTRANR